MKLLAALAAAMLATSPALAVQYTFTALPSGFGAVALNNVGQIAGSVFVPGTPGSLTPAIYAGGTVTLLNLPVPITQTATLTGINDAGDLSGTFFGQFGKGSTPFTVFGGVVGTPASPSVVTQSGTQANGLNNQRQVVGSAVNGQDFTPEGYVSTGGTFATVNVPGLRTYTQALGINNAGAVVGGFGPGPGLPYQQGFLDEGGTFTTIAVPGSTGTLALAVNDGGEIAGRYQAADGSRGFTEVGGVFSDITGPDGAAFFPVGLNNAGQLVGGFGNGVSYLATPQQAVPEPGTAALLGGVAALGAVLRRRSPKRGAMDAAP